MNQAAFAEFIRSIRFSKRESRNYEGSESAVSPLRERHAVKIIQSGEPFWTALGKTYAKLFLKVLGITILIAIVGTMYRKAKRAVYKKEERDL